MKKMLVVLTLVLLLMAVAEYFSIDPVWFLIVWYLSDNISAWTGASSVGVGTACGTDTEQIFSIHLFRSEPLDFQGFLPVFDRHGTDGTDVNILSSYIRKNI